MLGWFADAPNPDMGLLGFRRISDELGSTPWYLRLLRDVFQECWRVLEPGGRIAVNVANLGRKPYRSLSADVIRILEHDLGLLLRGELLPPALMGTADLPNPWHWQHLLSETVQQHMLSPVPCAMYSTGTPTRMPRTSPVMAAA